MLIATGILVFWVVVAVGIHWRRREYYRQNPWAWNQRGQGLISFNDRQVFWMTNLWPLTVVATVLYILVCWGSLLIEWITDLNRKW